MSYCVISHEPYTDEKGEIIGYVDGHLYESGFACFVKKALIPVSDANKFAFSIDFNAFSMYLSSISELNIETILVFNYIVNHMGDCQSLNFCDNGFYDNVIFCDNDFYEDVSCECNIPIITVIDTVAKLLDAGLLSKFSNAIGCFKVNSDVIKRSGV